MRKARILIVDDDREICTLVQKIPDTVVFVRNTGAHGYIPKVFDIGHMKEHLAVHFFRAAI